MNREIKFRAWDVKTLTMKDLGGLPDIADSDCRNWNDFILMQYIGLKDKNGKGIYEGDLLSDDEGGVDQVIYEGCGFVTKYWFDSNELVKESENVEIIGNIYENPELAQK